MCLLREEYVLDVSGILLGTVTNFVLMDSNSISSGKRDGMSKEGSGRVAVYKATGLIKCYTLEGNYNTGKTVNVLPPHGKDLTARKSNLPVPKYTPAIFEEVKIGFSISSHNLQFDIFLILCPASKVGRALGPSILDLTSSNPMSRIQNSEFRSVHGLRRALLIEIERGPKSSSVFSSAANKVNYLFVLYVFAVFVSFRAKLRPSA